MQEQLEVLELRFFKNGDYVSQFNSRSLKITYDGWNPPYEERVYLGPEPLSESPDKPANDGQKKL